MPWQPRKIEIDFELLRDSSAKDGLLHLIQRRTDTLYEHLSDFEPDPSVGVGDYGFQVPNDLPAIRLSDKRTISENDQFGFVNGLMLFTPVHPLTLTMAVSVACVRPDHDVTESGESMLTSYVAGIRIPLERPLIDLEPIADDKEISRLLDLNDAYREALEQFAESLVLVNGKLVPPPPLLLGANVEAQTLPTAEQRADWLNNAPVSRLDVLCACWLVVNPIFQLNIEYGWRRSAWLCKDLNNAVHDTIAQFDFLLDQANERVNQVLEQTRADTELTSALTRQRHLSRQLIRARRFYEWDADEIWANQSGHIARGSTPPAYVLPRRLTELLESEQQS